MGGCIIVAMLGGIMFAGEGGMEVEVLSGGGD